MLFDSFNLLFKIFEMMDAKARQDCIKEIDLLKVCTESCLLFKGGLRKESEGILKIFGLYTCTCIFGIHFASETF